MGKKLVLKFFQNSWLTVDFLLGAEEKIKENNDYLNN
jgi:hypothetical protein